VDSYTTVAPFFMNWPALLLAPIRGVKSGICASSTGVGTATMMMSDLLAMNVAGVAAKNSLLAMWTIGTHLEMAMRLGRVWGFSYVTDLFVWDKEKIGMGYHTRKQAELCLLFKRGKGLPVKSHSVRQIIRAPKREHSRKPDEQYDALDALYGTDLRRLELFARQQRPGWTAWGLETSKFGEAA
jgi:N6-adenosine-specific RNA methylase IME4